MGTAGCRAMVDLSAYAANLRAIAARLHPGCGFIAVVKADAYGHGALPIARKAVECGAAMLAVATVDEGAALRQGGVTAPILVMVQTTREAIETAILHDLRLIISDVATAECIAQAARKARRVASVHCKLDTGMTRQGFHFGEASTALKQVAHLSNLDIEGVMTHFASADEPGDTFTHQQVRNLRRALRDFEEAGIPYAFIHAANSGAIVSCPESYFDMVRPGLLSYGVWPCEDKTPDPAFHPVLRWEAEVTLLRDVPEGSTIGYGRTFTAPRPMRVAMLPVGYADGYKRALSGKASVLIRGKRRSVLGRVSMDQISVDVTGAPDVALGDVATLIGADGDEVITADELAKLAGTISYEILTGISARVPRVHTT